MNKPQKITPFKHFCLNIGVIPSAYTDAMSYYELLEWLCKFLQETVIPTVNNNSEVVTELQDYVTHYFDNLDVQEEINAKLDDMAESGVLADIIAQYIELQGQLTYNNVQEMKEAQNITNGSFLKTYGFHSYNDGGCALYKARTITNDDIVDNVTIIPLYDDSLIAELIKTDVDLMQFGCYGDNEHDDTNAIKYALTYALNNGLTVTSPNSKTYLISDDLTIGDINVYLDNCTFNMNNGITITADYKTLNFPRIHSLTLPNNKTAINLLHCHNDIIKIPHIYGFNIGLLLSASSTGCADNQIYIQEICNCLVSIKCDVSDTGWVTENMFIGGKLWQTGTFNTAHGADIIKIFLNGTETYRVNNCYFLKQDIEGNEGTLNGLKIKLSNARYNVFDNLRYEGESPKIDATNSTFNVLRDGYYLNNVTFVNDPVTFYLNGVTSTIRNGGTLNQCYIDFYPSAGSNEVIRSRRTTGTKANGLSLDGLTYYNSSENPQIRYSDGIQGYYNSNWRYMMRSWAQWTLMTNCNYTNGGLVITPGTNLDNACYLWISDGHLYGKIGSPSSASDGTVIL